MTDEDAGHGHDRSQPQGEPPPQEHSGPREAAWDDVAAQFSNLGKQLRSRFERPAGDQETREHTGAGGETVRRWIDSLDETFTRLGNTVRDPAFRKEAESSVGRLGEALGVSLRDLGDQLQRRFARDRSAEVGEGASAPGTPPPAPGDRMPDVPPPPAPAPPAGGTPPPAPPAGGPPAGPPPADPSPPGETPADPLGSAEAPADPPPAGGDGPPQPTPDERPPAT